ncbi:hypothetical protein GDO86_005673, partial [Hymenochirus boettgeri]
QDDLYLPESSDLHGVTVSDDLKGVTVYIVVDAEQCNATCGPGFRRERRCSVDSSGAQKNCEAVLAACIVDYMCRIKMLTFYPGEKINIDCLTISQIQANGNFNFYWKVSRGILTTNDRLFRPLKNWDPSLNFPSIQEKNAGTYRCDVRKGEGGKLVKRAYYGVKVLNPRIFNLNYKKIAESKQAIKNLNEQPDKDIPKPGKPGSRLPIILGVGIGVGTLSGLGILCAMFRICKAKPPPTPKV